VYNQIENGCTYINSHLPGLPGAEPLLDQELLQLLLDVGVGLLCQESHPYLEIGAVVVIS